MGRRGRGFKSCHPDDSVAAVTDGGHFSLEPRDPAGRVRFDPLRVWLLCGYFATTFLSRRPGLVPEAVAEPAGRARLGGSPSGGPGT